MTTELLPSSTLKRNHLTSNNDGPKLDLNDIVKKPRIENNRITTTTKSGGSGSGGDVFSRTKTTGSKGRGSLTGWARCPVCFPDDDGNGNGNGNSIPKSKTKSTKKYALGRGIAAHLRAVHTPWSPGKGELRRREGIRRRIKGLVARAFSGKAVETKTSDGGGVGRIREEGESELECYDRVVRSELGDEIWDRDGTRKPVRWEPAAVEIEAWDRRVLELTQLVEGKATAGGDRSRRIDGENTTAAARDDGERRKIPRSGTDGFVPPGHDRDGTPTIPSYERSLPPFLRAAAVGDLSALREMTEAEPDDDAVRILVATRDRNGSTAEHWAAGGGHLSCLEFLTELRPAAGGRNGGGSSGRSTRKRDGKTSLHYAARNGHNDIIDYLLSDTNTTSTTATTTASNDPNYPPTKPIVRTPDVDVPSGDGTTPLHLACYGGNLRTVRHLVERHRADTRAVNEWGCGMGHWLAMSIHPDPSERIRALEYTKTFRRGPGTDAFGAAPAPGTFDLFGTAQKQGHTAVHKAAQKLNGGVLKWLVEEAKGRWTEEERMVAGGVDIGGNRPSDIWSLMGGGDEFKEWIKTECNW